MLDEIQDISNVPKYIDMAKDKTNSFLISGFGHRVYKNYDPRAKVMQVICHELIDEDSPPEELKRYDSTLKGLQNVNRQKNLEVAMALEKVALNDPYFIH